MNSLSRVLISGLCVAFVANTASAATVLIDFETPEATTNPTTFPGTTYIAQGVAFSTVLRSVNTTPVVGASTSLSAVSGNMFIYEGSNAFSGDQFAGPSPGGGANDLLMQFSTPISKISVVSDQTAEGAQTIRLIALADLGGGTTRSLASPKDLITQSVFPRGCSRWIWVRPVLASPSSRSRRSKKDSTTFDLQHLQHRFPNPPPSLSSAWHSPVSASLASASCSTEQRIAQQDPARVARFSFVGLWKVKSVPPREWRTKSLRYATAPPALGVADTPLSTRQRQTWRDHGYGNR